MYIHALRVHVCGRLQVCFSVESVKYLYKYVPTRTYKAVPRGGTSTDSKYYTGLREKSKTHFYGPGSGLIGVLAYI